MLRDDPNESSAVYLLTSDDKHAVCGTDFPKSTSLSKIFSVVLLCRGDFRSRAGQRKRSSFTDMQIWDDPWAFQTPPYDDTQGITDMKTGKNRGKELKNV